MAKQTILVVDDEKDLLDLIEYNLKKEGFAVLKAENGEEGIKIAKEHKPETTSASATSGLDIDVSPDPAHDDVSSENDSIRKQAAESRDPEAGENIL